MRTKIARRMRLLMVKATGPNEKWSMDSSPPGCLMGAGFSSGSGRSVRGSVCLCRRIGRRVGRRWRFASGVQRGCGSETYTAFGTPSAEREAWDRKAVKTKAKRAFCLRSRMPARPTKTPRQAEFYLSACISFTQTSTDCIYHYGKSKSWPMSLQAQRNRPESNFMKSSRVLRL
jgi:hypothetical protein